MDQSTAQKNEPHIPASQLLKILAVNSKINSTLDIDELLGIIMVTASEVMSAEAASLLLLDEGTNELIFRIALGEKGGALVEKFRVKMGEGICGSVARSGESVIVNDVKKDSRFAQRFDAETGFETRAVLCIPMRAKGKIIGVLEAINPVGRKAFSANELELFEVFADQAALAVENAKLHAEILKQEKAKQELRIANEIQQNFLPDLKTIPLEIDVAARNIPAREVGGDFYDVLRLDENRTGVLIADVSGKGVPAALFMVNAISDFRFLAPRFRSPAELLGMLNNALAKNSTRGMFITLLYLIIDRKQNTLEYTSAGHNPVLKRSPTGEISELENIGGVPLGLISDEDYQQRTVPITAGDIFFLYTDGVTEARNTAGQEYSIRNLKKQAEEPAACAEVYAKRVFSDLEKFTDRTNQHDDITLLVIKIPARHGNG